MSLLIGLVVAIVILVISVKVIVKLASPPTPPELSREWKLKVFEGIQYYDIGIQRGGCYHLVGSAKRADSDFEQVFQDVRGEAVALAQDWNEKDQTVTLLTQEVE